VIAGNHDSAPRLDAPNPLFQALDVHVVGALPRREDRSLDAERLIVPLRDATDAVAAWVAAVPFLRPADLEPIREDGVDPLIEGVRRVYAGALAAARERRETGQALIATGHAYLVGTQLSELSERKILGGNQHALPVDVFGEDVTYVALGHLHLAQTVGCEHVRYSGSPIPLSMTEVGYPHQVLLVELEGERLLEAKPLRIPRTIQLQRLPEDGPRPIEEVMKRIAGLPDRGEGPDELRPLLEVRAELPSSDPGARLRIEAACEGKEPRLVNVSLSRRGSGGGLVDELGGEEGSDPGAASLAELDPEGVFRLLHERRFGGTPPDDLLEAFHELLDRAGQEGGA